MWKKAAINVNTGSNTPIVYNNGSAITTGPSQRYKIDLMTQTSVAGAASSYMVYRYEGGMTITPLYEGGDLRTPLLSMVNNTLTINLRNVATLFAVDYVVIRLG